jgi:hypothetical protein
MMPQSPLVASLTSPTSPTSPTPPPWWKGNSPPLNYEFMEVACSISLLCYDVEMPYELANMIMAILCNSYVVDPIFIGRSMRCESLSCSCCMSRWILLPRSLLLVVIQLLCESMCGEWCVLDGVTWYVVVVNCDNNFTSCYGVYQFHCYLTMEKKNTCAISF